MCPAGGERCDSFVSARTAHPYRARQCKEGPVSNRQRTNIWYVELRKGRCDIENIRWSFLEANRENVLIFQIVLLDIFFASQKHLLSYYLKT